MNTQNSDMNRKKFMLRSTKALSAVSILPAFSFAGSNSTREKIKVVLLGTGSRGSGIQ